MGADMIPGICAGHNHVFDYVVLRPALLPISQRPRKWRHSWPSQQLPQYAAQAPTEQQDFLTENGTTFMVPSRLCTEKACLVTACVVGVRRVKGLLPEYQANAVFILPIF